MSKYSKYLPFILALSVYSGLILFIYVSILSQNGQFIYPLDDTYIHLTLARNLAQFGVLGISPMEFSYLTSSPLWTAILYLTNFVLGESLYNPFVINIIIGFLFVIYITKISTKISNNLILSTFFAVAIIASSSVFLLIFIGMEHLLHTFLFLLYIVSFKKIYDSKLDLRTFPLIILTILLVLTRFESLFIVFATAIIFVYDKKYKYSVLISISALVPIIVLGLYSISQGGYFIPNSLLMKGEFSTAQTGYELMKSVIYHPVKKLVGVPLLVVILLILFVTRFKLKNNNVNRGLLKVITIFLISAFLHLLFAQVGWLYRYESYLIIVGFVILVIALSELYKQWLPIKLRNVLIVLIGLSIPIILRGYITTVAVPKASKNIYEQQWYMSEFFKQYYQNHHIALNDIGLISYRSRVRIHDIWGLANKRLLDLRTSKLIDGDILEEYLDENNIKIAVIFEPWFKHKSGFPAEWFKAGTWEIDNNIICGEPKVSFFAKDSVNYRNLVKNLISFSNHLPTDVKQNINKR